LTEVIAHSSPTEARYAASFIVRARNELLGEVVQRVLQGERFLALSGAPGTGKSVMARAIYDELLGRSVPVFRIRRGENDSIGARSIICQLLHKPEAAFQPNDVETMFDTLLARGDDDERHAIIIDDAELLQPDAVQYLRLVSNIVPEQMPPVVLIGRSSFWDMPGQPASSDAHDLLTCRMELERLSDEEAHAFIRETLPDAAAHALLGDAACEALVRHADGSIGRLAALLTAARDMPGATDKPGDRPIIIDQADGPKPVLTIDEPPPVTAPGFAVTILPASEIVLNPGAVSPPPAQVQNSPRWASVVRYGTAAVMMLTAVAAVAYWQLAIHSGQIRWAAVSAAPASAASSGVADVAQPQAAPRSSNAAIDGNVATEPPAQASPAAGASPSPPGPLLPSIQPALTAPVFRAVSTDDADQPPAPLAAELSVALSDDPEMAWLVLDSARADQLLSLASAAPEPPPQPPAIGNPAAGVEPGEPEAQSATVPDKPSLDKPSLDKPPEVSAAPLAPAAPPPAADNALAAAPASPDPGAGVQPSPGDAADAGRPERNAETAPIVASEPSSPGPPTAEPKPPPAESVALPPAVPAIPQPVPDITASPAVPAAPSGSPLVATPAPARPEQEAASPPVLAPTAPVPPQQAATAPLPPVATPDEVTATAPQVPAAATTPVAPPPPMPAAVDVAAPQAPVAPTVSVADPAASLPVPQPPKPPPPAAPVASVPHLDLGLLLSRADAMLALGDISAARLLYERAAALGSAGAATALGNTYDASFLASIQAKGIVADEAAAIAWYRKAAALGDAAAVRQLNRLAPAQ
jgi:type II secretory pathway predicted ATPase ExeA